MMGPTFFDAAAADDDHHHHKHLRPWRRRLLSSLMALRYLSWACVFRSAVFLFLLAAVVTTCVTLPIEQFFKDFLIWVKQDLGPWGPLVLAVAYIPLTVLSVPASVLTLGGGYLFGLLVGFVADSVGATLGATASFFLGRTFGRSYVTSKLKNYPKFQAVSIAIHRSGFKIVLLLRLAPLVPFNMLDYLLSVTPVNLGELRRLQKIPIFVRFQLVILLGKTDELEETTVPVAAA